ncbi:MAG: STAS domain-containing protein [Herpetosiphonaceae bacterium]|nr:STAS domain-containing protein [Herpetosiphonaceae bacterium]
MASSSPYVATNINQRLRFLQYFALAVCGLMVLATLLLIFAPLSTISGWIYGVAAMSSAFVWWLGRRQRLVPGTVLLLVTFTAINLNALIQSTNIAQDVYVVLPFLLLQIPATALLLNARFSLITTGLIFVLIAGSLMLTMQTIDRGVILFITSVVTLLTGGITGLTMRQLENALHTSEAQTTMLRQSEHTLQQQALALKERTAEAEQRQQEAATAMHQMERALHERDDLAHSLQEATLPVMPVHKQVIVLPLVGSVDSTRAVQLTTTILENVKRSNARAVIIDVTGVPLIDTQVAGVLLKSAEAVRLLGATTVLVGIRPEVAQTIVGLGLSLNSLTVRADLQSGIQAAMELIAAQRS